MQALLWPEVSGLFTSNFGVAAFNPPGESIDRELPPPFVKIIGPYFTVPFIAGEHVKDTTHNRVRYGNDGPLLPTADGEALI
jgi:hypothetical protein